MQDEAVNYYHKALHLGCCSSPRSASANVPNFEILVRDHPFSMNNIYFEKLTVHIPRYAHVRFGIWEKVMLVFWKMYMLVSGVK